MEVADLPKIEIIRMDELVMGVKAVNKLYLLIWKKLKKTEVSVDLRKSRRKPKRYRESGISFLVFTLKEKDVETHIISNLHPLSSSFRCGMFCVKRLHSCVLTEWVGSIVDEFSFYSIDEHNEFGSSAPEDHQLYAINALS